MGLFSRKIKEAYSAKDNFQLLYQKVSRRLGMERTRRRDYARRSSYWEDRYHRACEQYRELLRENAALRNANRVLNKCLEEDSAA